MSRVLHFATSNVAGHGPPDTGSLPCMGFYGRTTSILCSSSGGDRKSLLPLKGILLQCTSRKTSLCKVTSSSNESLNPDFSKQNRQISSGSRRWQKNEERESLVNLEERDPLRLKNGPLFSPPSVNKNKGTAAPSPGPREREIIELFRKVQAQLRERTAMKQEKKVEIAREAGPSKESEAVDSLLELLRKHSAKKVSKKVNGGEDSGTSFNLDQSGQSWASGEGKSRNFFKSSSTPKNDEAYDIDRPLRARPSSNIMDEQHNIDRPLRVRPLSNFGDEVHDIDRPLRVRPLSNFKDESCDIDKPLHGRPASNFRRKSPVPRVRYEPITSPKEAASTAPRQNLDGRSSSTGGSSSSYLTDDSELAETDIEQEPEFEDDLEMESGYMADEMDGDLSEIDGSLESEVISEQEHARMPDESKQEDLSSMNLQKLRALAKTRGFRGYSKMKKMELVGLLSRDPSVNQ